MHGAGRAKAGTQIVHTDHKEAACIDGFTGPNHVVPPAFTFVLAFVDARDMVRRIQRMANENRIGLVGVKPAVSLEGQVIGADSGATLQSKWRFKKHRLRRSDQWHEGVQPKKAVQRIIGALKLGWRVVVGDGFLGCFKRCVISLNACRAPPQGLAAKHGKNHGRYSVYPLERNSASNGIT